MAEKTYTEQQNIKYKQKLNELLDILPDFCTQYFDSLEFNKQPRTKIAYAMDIKGFFEFLIECVPQFKSYSMKDFNPSDLEKIDGTDITKYLRHVKLYKKNGRDVTNSESAAKRKLCALRRFYAYYYRYEIISSNPTMWNQVINLPKRSCRATKSLKHVIWHFLHLCLEPVSVYPNVLVWTSMT